jgi:hypothetical protein
MARKDMVSSQFFIRHNVKNKVILLYQMRVSEASMDRKERKKLISNAFIDRTERKGGFQMLRYI